MAKTKKNPFFIVMRILGLFLMGLIVAVFVALSQVNLESLRGNVLAVLKNATDLPVEIDGSVSWKFSLRPQVELNKVRVPNADWAKHDFAFSAERIDVTLNLLSLFRGSPTIQNVKVYDATVCIEQNDKGEYSISQLNKPKTESVAQNTETESVALIDAAGKSEKKPTSQPKYPFEDPGLGGVEIKNLVAHILGKSYSLAGFQIRYTPSGNGREYSGWIKSSENVFPFIMSYSEYNPERKVYPVRIAFATGGDALIANIALEGTSKAPIDFIIKGDIPDIAAVGELLQLDLAQMPKLSVNISGGFDWKKITLRNSSVKVRGMDINFSGSLDWSKKVPVIIANIDSKYISLLELFPDLYGRKWVRPNRELNVFKDIPLHGKEFLDTNLSLHASIDNLIVYRELNIGDIDLDFKLKDGAARVDANVMMGGGDIKIGGDIDIAADGHVYVKAGMSGTNISVGEILNQIQTSDFISDLPVNAEMYVQANGMDLSELMHTITGPVRVYSTGAGYAHSALVANMYGTDFLTSLRHSIQDLFRTDKKYNQIKISCVAVNAKLRGGVFETQHGVAAETNAINVRLAGSLDLGNETMRMSLTTVPVRGLKLSLTGNVVNSIEITGNLAEPDIKISGAAVAGKVASATGIGLLLAPFTGGIGLVAGAGVGLLAGDLLENWLADDKPCETALERGAPPRRDDADWINAPLPDLLSEVLK